MKHFLLIITCISVLSSISEAQSVRALVLPDSVAIGDTFQYIITAQYATGRYQTVFPDSSAFGGDIEFKGVQRFRGVASRDSVVYTLQFFALKDTLLPPKQVLFVQGDEQISAATPPLQLFFRSVLKPEEDNLRPLKPIFSFARSWLPLLIAILFLLIAGALLYYYRDRFNFSKKDVQPDIIPAEPFRHPIRELQREILELQQVTNFQKDNFRSFYTRISIAFRQYLEDVYKIPALESTTKELIRDLKKTGGDDIIITTLDKLLRECDLVKFARYQPDIDQATKTYAYAEQLVRLLRRSDEARIERLKISYEIRHGLRDPENPKNNKRIVNPLITPKDTL